MLPQLDGGSMKNLDHYRYIVESSPDCVQEVDVGGRVTSINQSGCVLLQLDSPDEIIGRDWVALWPKSSHHRLELALKAAFVGQPSQFTAMCPTLKGEERWWFVAISPALDAEGHPDSALIVSRDVTERLRVDEALETINQSLQAKLTVVNAAREQGIQRESMLQQRLDIAAAAQALAEQLSHQAQKNEAVGQLVAGIAHDFNNMLQTIIGGLSAVLDDSARLASDQRSFLGYSMEGARHAVILAKRLMAFVRVHRFQAEAVELQAVVTDIIDFASHSLGSGIHLKLEGTGERFPTLADRHGIEQAVMNLCINARDACSGQGGVVISFGHLDVQEAEASSLREAGAYVTLSVADHGTGMDAETRERLFEPYFTTKKAGQGTGLGLAQIYGFMRQSGGFVDVHTELGVGTTMTLAFPLDVGRELQRTAEACLTS
jgi:PAS domain S-box-containing protein